MTSLGRPTAIQGAAIPLRRRDLRSPTRGRTLIQDSMEDRLWNYYDTVPAIGNYVQTLSNSADLVAYYPGVIDPESAEPVPVEDGPVADLWEEIGGEAAVSEWVSSLVVHLSVPGQGWFVPMINNQLANPDPDNPDDTPIIWSVVSTADLRRLLKLTDATASIPEEDNRIWRIYSPHPKNSSQPDSPTRRVATQAQILTLIEQRRIADLHSRIHAGVWPLPASLRNQTTPSGKAWGDILEEGLIAAAIPGALEALVPLLAWVEPGEAAEIKPPIRLSLDDSEKLNALQEQVLRQLAIGLDAPVELTLGIGGMNHWGAWLSQEQTFTQHLDPLVVRILRSLMAWWQAQVSAKGVADPENHLIWRNPATAINRPDTFAEAKDLHDRFVISDDALLRAADKDDTDKPDEAEIERRIEIQRLLNGTPEEPSVDQIRSEPDDNPVQAASRPLALGRLARRLTDLDQTALIRLEAEAARQLRKRRRSLLDRIETAAAKRGIQAASDNETLPMRLGPSVVQELIPGNLAEPGDFDPAPFNSILEAAQEEAGAATSVVGVDRDEEADNEDRVTAVTFLLAALAAALVGSLFRRPDTTGEQGVDGAEWVPMADLRRTMDTAGGGTLNFPRMENWELIGNGKRTVDGLALAGIATEGFEWVYGQAPRRTFEPHLNLDGEFFTRFDDEVLRQGEGSWVTGDFFFPGDHRGCRCSYVRTLVAESELVGALP